MAADQVTGQISPSITGGEGFYQFTLDGIASSNQMDRLIKLTEDLVKKLVGEGADSLKNLSRTADDATEAVKRSTKVTKELKAAEENLRDSYNHSTHIIRDVFHKNFTNVLVDVSKPLAGFSIAVGTVFGSLVGYSKSLSEGLKRGVAGNTFDLAIAAKSAGVGLSDFTKALADSGGGFASLGDNATDGARQFGSLIRNVRTATASVGNLGLNNEELAKFTAEQTKVAISQGFKGKQAQDVVIRNSRILGIELDDLASKTGKSVLELAQAATKLSQDPIVASFVSNAKAGGKQVSEAIQTFAANMRGIFGEKGEKLGLDILQSATSGLPLIMTKTGKDMLLASQSFYNELEKQGKKVSLGSKQTEEDRQRLMAIAKQEVDVRGAQLRQFALLGGPIGESATALLDLAKEAEFYNSKEGERQRRQADTAKQFNTELNKLQASLQQALTPFLHALNMVDWGTVFNIVSYIPRKIGEIVDSIKDIFGGEDSTIVKYIGQFTGGIIGLVTTFGLLVAGVTVVKKLFSAVATQIAQLLKITDIRTTKEGVASKSIDIFTQALQRAAAALGGKIIIGGGGSRSGGLGGIPPAGSGSRGGSLGGIPPRGGRYGSIQLPESEPGAMGNRARRRMEEIENRNDRLARARELRRQNPGMTAADAMAQAQREIPTTTPTTPTTPTRTGKIAGKLGSVGDKLMSAKGIGIGVGATMLGSFIGEGMSASENLTIKNAGEHVSKLSDVAGTAMTGAMVGSMFGPIGTAIGAGIGGMAGIWKNYLRDEDASISNVLKKEKEKADEQIDKKLKLESDLAQKQYEQLKYISEQVSTGNFINARGVSTQMDIARSARQTALNAP